MDDLERLVKVMVGLEGVFMGAPIEERRVALILPEENDGLGVSTVQINDMPGWEYETAILDANAARPVERYHTIAEAEAGHLRWVEASTTLVSVIRLGGWGGAIPDTEFKLQRVPRPGQEEVSHDAEAHTGAVDVSVPVRGHNH